MRFAFGRLEPLTSVERASSRQREALSAEEQGEVLERVMYSTVPSCSSAIVDSSLPSFGQEVSVCLKVWPRSSV